jgi:hypothetical protein
MSKCLIALFFVLVFTAPALAKSPDVYPVPCKDLWEAVKDMLGDVHNYGIISEEDEEQRALFVVVGSQAHYTQKVVLRTKNSGCIADATVLEIGPDNSDWRQFQHRLALSLTKLQAAKAKPAANGIGQPR